MDWFGMFLLEYGKRDGSPFFVEILKMVIPFLICFEWGGQGAQNDLFL